jgi:protein PsiE
MGLNVKDIITNKKLHWTTILGEKIILAVIGVATIFAAGTDVYAMVASMQVELSDLFMLFIYAEVIGMIGAFYSTERIPVTLPIIIAITALCRLIVLHSKEMEPLTLIGEAGAIFILAGAAYIMSLKDKISLDKLKLRGEINE